MVAMASGSRVVYYHWSWNMVSFVVVVAGVKKWYQGGYSDGGL